MHTKAITFSTGRNGATHETPRAVSAPFGYYGSKQRLSSRIVADLPPHNAWVEAFCGSAALTLAKEPAPIEVINDINGEIVNFFRVLRDDSGEMCRLLSLTPYARQELHEARVKATGLSDVERARRFFVAAMMAINGCFGKDKGGFSFSNSYSRRGMEARVSRWNAMPDHLKVVADRLKPVRIENQDAINLFREFMDRPATLVYLDPPYLADRNHGYDHDQKSEEFHEHLLKTAIKAKCMVLISGYKNDLYQDYLTKDRGWRKRTTKTTTRGHNGKDSEREEIVWFNEQYQTARQSKRIPVRFSRNEKDYGKVNPKRSR
jgi:DNA adenine methylase